MQFSVFSPSLDHSPSTADMKLLNPGPDYGNFLKGKQQKSN